MKDSQRYDFRGNYPCYTNLRVQDTVGSLTLYSNSFTPPSGAYKVKIGLGSELQSGPIAFDDLHMVESSEIIKGLSVPGLDPEAETLYETGFESDNSSWGTSKSGEFPATSIWNGTWGTGAPHRGSRAVVVSNHAYGYLNSPEIAVQPNATYYLSAWMRRELVLRYARGHLSHLNGRRMAR